MHTRIFNGPLLYPALITSGVPGKQESINEWKGKSGDAEVKLS
jgi:hypothetical protein